LNQSGRPDVFTDVGAHKAAAHNRKDRAVRRIINKAVAGVGVLGVATGIVLASAAPASAEPTAAAATARPGILTVCASGTYNARVVVKGRDGQGNNGLQNALTSQVAAPNTCADVGISGTLGQGDVNVFVEGDFGNGFQDIGVGTFNNLSAGAVTTAFGDGLNQATADFAQANGQATPLKRA
jgi:hypothetical protein